MIFFCIIFICLIVSGQNTFSAEKVAVAKKRESNIHIDGKLLEEDWRQAIPISDFTTKDPVEGGAPSEKIEVRFLYDEEYLYIGARMERKNPEKIQAYVSRRDNMSNSERIIIILDTYNNKQTAVSFAVTATGVRADYFHATDSEGDRDYNYNPVWEARTNIDSLGWTAEYAIPFSQLRFPNADTLVFGLNVNQYTPTTQEDAYWVMIPKNQSGWASRFGKLVGIEGIRKTRRIELLPYVSTTLEKNPNISSNHPYFNEWDWRKSVGVDFKMGFGPNVTLDATINPDFGQVEADPSVVNLSEFEVYYDEKRPFFIEGNQLFRKTNVDYYYSRRIGEPPAYRLYSQYARNPLFSTILGAAKITGRSSDGWSYAALTAFVDKEYGKDYDTVLHKKTQQIVSPYSLYSVVRAQKELDESGSFFGAILTAVNRQNSEDYLHKYYNDAAYSGGIDWNIFLFDKTYSFYGNLGFSAINGTKERITIIQTSITQNFQRPDAKHLSVDTNANWLTGLLGRVGFKKIAGEHWIWTAEYYTETPGLNFNDFGKLQHADEHKFYFGITYRENKPSDYLYSYYLNAYSSYVMNWDYEQIQNTIGMSYGVTFLNKYSIEGGFYYLPHYFSDTKTRGGMMVALAPSYNLYGSISSDWSKPMQYSVDYNYSWALDNTKYSSISTYLFHNFDRSKISIDFSYSQEIDPKIYLGSRDNNNPETYNKRYIFGEIRQKTFSTSLRINYAISPDFTFESYFAPYFTNGKYLSFGEALNRKNYALKVYGKYSGTSIEENENYYKIADGNDEFNIGKQDFYFKSFRSSVVIRWEFLPGSQLYLVWQVNDSRYDKYQKIMLDDFSDLLGRKARHSFMMKISYWFANV
ncbi:MAG: carbohydrate binding family 9 domain-containing protein [Ignavibacteria bacterium]|nr:carbohydrate binding family 9 domain-containing protein [Ignavibacteria bacterium]